MTTFVIELKPSTELLIVLTELVAAFNRTAAAMEAQTPARSAAVQRIVAAPEPLEPGAWITDARKDVLRQRMPEGAQWPEIEAEMAALPGAPLPSRDTIRIYARAQLGLTRPETSMTEAQLAGVKRLAAARANARAAPKADRWPIRDPGEAIEADFEQVRTFTASKGLRFESWDDLPAINAWCRDPRRGLPGFKRKFARVGSSA